MGGFTAGVAAVLRATFTREALPPSPPPEPSQASRPGGWSLLFGADPFPPDLPPLASPGAAPPRGWQTSLLGADPFPPDLPPMPRRAGRWLAWLVGAEPLDP